MPLPLSGWRSILRCMSSASQFRPALVLVTHDLLVDCARVGRKTSYRELYDKLALECSWPPYAQGHAWMTRMKPYLAEVGTLCGERGEPCLSALVRQQDGKIGKGFATAYYNCYHTRITRHDDGCPCGNCTQYIQQAAQKETRKCFDRWQGT